MKAQLLRQKFSDRAAELGYNIISITWTPLNYSTRRKKPVGGWNIQLRGVGSKREVDAVVCGYNAKLTIRGFDALLSYDPRNYYQFIGVRNEGSIEEAISRWPDQIPHPSPYAKWEP